MEAAEPGSYATYAKKLGLDPRMHLHGSPLFTSVWCGFLPEGHVLADHVDKHDLWVSSLGIF
jgi:hypothetical protein